MFDGRAVPGSGEARLNAVRVACPIRPRLRRVVRGLRYATGITIPLTLRHCQTHKEKTPTADATGVFGLKPGSDLLSHGKPHTTIGDALFHF